MPELRKLPRFYPILDLETVYARKLDPLRSAREILDAGARILQFRHKGAWTAETLQLLDAIGRAAHDAHATLVVNDRADFAKISGAALHLGQEDLPPADARLIVGDQTWIGLSTHNETQLLAASVEPVDYLALGPVFGTASKHNPDPAVGLAELTRLRSLTDRPLVAIGGITRENAAAAFEAGADSVAVIGDLFAGSGNPGARAREWLQLFS